MPGHFPGRGSQVVTAVMTTGLVDQSNVPFNMLPFGGAALLDVTVKTAVCICTSVSWLVDMCECVCCSRQLRIPLTAQVYNKETQQVVMNLMDEACERLAGQGLLRTSRCLFLFYRLFPCRVALTLYTSVCS